MGDAASGCTLWKRQGCVGTKNQRVVCAHTRTKALRAAQPHHWAVVSDQGRTLFLSDGDWLPGTLIRLSIPPLRPGTRERGGPGKLWVQGARSDLEQGVLTGGDDQAELKDPDVSEEAFEQQQVSQEGNQAAQSNAKNVLHYPPRPTKKWESGQGFPPPFLRRVGETGLCPKDPPLGL